jgi:hypothetical protein
MAKRKKRSKRSRPNAATTFRATAGIAGYVSSETATVDISTRNGDKKRHAVFSFTQVPAAFAGQFQTMAQASASPTVYTYPSEPTTREVAERFVLEKLPPNWSIGDALGSCWTPSGWQPPQGERCQSFPLRVNNRQVSQALHRFDGSKLLYLRFAVSVKIVPN